MGNGIAIPLPKVVYSKNWCFWKIFR
jgi:hypothetical protein